MRRLSIHRLLVPLLCLLFATSLLAQGQTQYGNVIGRVTGPDGAVLPGVTVTLSGIGAPQTFVTTEDGEYRFRNLHPGRYTLSAELSGFSPVRQNVDVAVGRNTEAALRLSPSAAEAITVTAATPLIDTRETGTGATVDAFELEQVPTARDPWVVLQSVPGVLVDRVNVGGNESGQQSYFVGKGVERHQTEWNIDGVAVSDMAATGTSTFYYDFDAFEEMNITTGSADPSVRTPGVRLNMVTKRGTNELRGSSRFFYTSEAFQSEGTIPAEARDYLAQGTNSVDLIRDYGVEAGGPIIRDRLWFWGAYSNNGINNFSSAATQLQRTKLNNWNGKLNLQVTANNSAAAYYMWNDKKVVGRGLSPTRPIETAQNQTGPGYIIKLEDTHQFSPNLYVTALAAQIDSGYELTPIGGLDQSAWWDEKEGWHRTYRYYRQEAPQQNARADGSAYVKTGSVNNELKFGFGYRDTPVESITTWPGNMSFGNFYDGFARAALTRPAVPNFGSRYVDVYAGDTIAFGNLTLTGGLRYDLQRAKNFGSEVPANPVAPDKLPAATYAGDDRALEWKGLSPRIGATWALGQSRRTVLRTSYSRYMDQLGSSDAGTSNPFYRVQMLYYSWTDRNGDKTVQRDEVDFSRLFTSRNIDPANPAAGYSPGRLDYDVDPTRTDEIILGVEREIGSAFAVGVAYSYRLRDNFVWDQFEKTRGSNDFYTSADYVLAGTRSGTLPDGTAYDNVPFYRLKPGTPVPLYYVTRNRPDYTQTYHGLELTATKRMSNRWMMRGNVTLQEWKQQVGPNGYVDPTAIVSGDSCTSCDDATVASSGGLGGYINSRWSYALNGVYQLPMNFLFGAAVVGREGYVVPYYIRANPGDGTGNKQLMISEEFGANRLPDLFNLDLRLARDFALPAGAAVNLSIDLFNVTNERTVLWRDNRMRNANGADPISNRIQQLQSPRIWRVGARFRF